jgi:hypothetical protein
MTTVEMDSELKPRNDLNNSMLFLQRDISLKTIEPTFETGLVEDSRR